MNNKNSTAIHFNSTSTELGQLLWQKKCSPDSQFWELFLKKNQKGEFGNNLMLNPWGGQGDPRGAMEPAIP